MTGFSRNVFLFLVTIVGVAHLQELIGGGGDEEPDTEQKHLVYFVDSNNVKQSVLLKDGEACTLCQLYASSGPFQSFTDVGPDANGRMVQRQNCILNPFLSEACLLTPTTTLSNGTTITFESSNNVSIGSVATCGVWNNTAQFLYYNMTFEAECKINCTAPSNPNPVQLNSTTTRTSTTTITSTTTPEPTTTTVTTTTTPEPTTTTVTTTPEPTTTVTTTTTPEPTTTTVTTTEEPTTTVTSTTTPEPTTTTVTTTPEPTTTTPCVTTEEPTTTTPCVTTEAPTTTTPCVTTEEPTTTTPCVTTEEPTTTTPCATTEAPTTEEPTTTKRPHHGCHVPNHQRKV